MNPVAEAVIEQLCRQNTIGVALIDREMRYVRVNEAAARMNGVPVEDHLGRTMPEVVPDSAGALAPLMAAVLAGHAILDGELEMDSGGVTKHFRGSYIPLNGDDGEVAGFVALVVERTEDMGVHRELRASQERLQLALEGTGTGTFEWDIETHDLHWSDTMGTIWGRGPGWQPAGYDEYAETLHPSDREELATSIARAAETGEGYQREFRIFLPDGSLRWVHSKVHVVSDDDGRARTLVGLINDITDRVALQQAERDANRRLRALESVTDVALAHLELGALLAELLQRVLDITGSALAEILLGSAERLQVRVHFVGDVDADPVATRRVPLMFDGAMIGALRLTWSCEPDESAAEPDLLELVADRAARAVAHARLYEEARQTTVTLQRNLLPETLPEIPRHTLAVRYLPGQEGAVVGGDFYDAFPLPGDRFAVLVGDVVGRGFGAATVMGQLRATLRAHVFATLDPVRALERVDAQIDDLGGVGFATVALMVGDVAGGDASIVLAGHPPPVVRHADGTCVRLQATAGVPIGAPLSPRSAHTLSLATGDLVLFYTDGLVEVRDVALDPRIEELAAACAAGPQDPDALLGHVVEAMLPRGRADDDVALLALQRT